MTGKLCAEVKDKANKSDTDKTAIESTKEITHMKKTLKEMQAHMDKKLNATTTTLIKLLEKNSDQEKEVRRLRDIQERTEE